MNRLEDQFGRENTHDRVENSTSGLAFSLCLHVTVAHSSQERPCS